MITSRIAQLNEPARTLIGQINDWQGFPAIFIKGGIAMSSRKFGLTAILLGSLMSVAVAMPAVAGSYGALASGFWKDEDGRMHAASGASWNSSSPGRADVGALEACSRMGRNCKVVRYFKNGGCGYISVGSNEHASRTGVGVTAERAFSACAQDGFVCKPALGGCTDTFD
jgi:hypothetical protein